MTQITKTQALLVVEPKAWQQAVKGLTAKRGKGRQNYWKISELKKNYLKIHKEKKQKFINKIENDKNQFLISLKEIKQSDQVVRFDNYKN